VPGAVGGSLSGLTSAPRVDLRCYFRHSSAHSGLHPRPARTERLGSRVGAALVRSTTSASCTTLDAACPRSTAEAEAVDFSRAMADIRAEPDQEGAPSWIIECCMAAIEKRYSVRTYEHRPVENEKLRSALGSVARRPRALRHKIRPHPTADSMRRNLETPFGRFFNPRCILSWSRGRAPHFCSTRAIGASTSSSPRLRSVSEPAAIGGLFVEDKVRSLLGVGRQP